MAIIQMFFTMVSEVMGLMVGVICVENPGISYSDILILIPDSRTVYDLIFTLFILLTLSR